MAFLLQLRFQGDETNCIVGIVVFKSKLIWEYWQDSSNIPFQSIWKLGTCPISVLKMFWISHVKQLHLCPENHTTFYVQELNILSLLLILKLWNFIERKTIFRLFTITNWLFIVYNMWSLHGVNLCKLFLLSLSLCDMEMHTTINVSPLLTITSFFDPK